jgi:hypothetical protein
MIQTLKILVVFVSMHSAICQEEESSDGSSAAIRGSSLIQGSAKSVKMTQILVNEDPFGDLEDSFDLSRSGLSPSLSAALILPNVDVWFLFRCVRDIMLFAIVVFIVPFAAGKIVQRRSLSVKRDEQAEQATSLECSLHHSPVNFLTLMEAARSGDEARWRAVLESIPNFARVQDRFGSTALHVAAGAPCEAMVAALLREMKGVNVNAKDVWEETPLHFAARVGSDDVCHLLLANGADVNAVSDGRETPLLVAAKAGQKATCQWLLRKGATCGEVADSDLPPMLAALFLDRLTPNPQAA